MISKKENSILEKATCELFDSKKISHGFMSRNGGFSSGPYNSLNTCNKVTEDKNNIVKNLAIIAEDFGVPANNLKLVNQVHSTIAIEVTDATTDYSKIEADAVVTKQTNILIGVNTADCTPILFADSKNGVVAAAHAGWKGALAGVIENTIMLMEKCGAEKKEITAVIGPTIAQKSYEVDENFKQQFLAKYSASSMFFIPSIKVGHHMFDLPNFCLSILNSQNIKSAENLNIDTYTHPETYFSCRRTFHSGEREFGGQLSAIMLKD